MSDVSDLCNNSFFFNEKNSEINKIRSDPESFYLPTSVGADDKGLTSFHGGVIITFKSDPIKKRTPPFLKLGLNYFSNSKLFGWSNGVYTKKTTDAIYYTNSPAFGRVDRDSISKTALTLLYQSQNINLEGDFLISTNQKKFISAYCGVSAIIGSNFNGTIKTGYEFVRSVSDYYAGSFVPVSDHIYYEEKKEETLKNKPGLSFGTAINFGVELKIVKKFRFYIEFKPGYRANKISSYQLTGSNIYQLNCGLKFSSK